jgi:uncharacterized DUF497 family protein
MEFEWDASKSDECARTRRFDFAYAARAFLILTGSLKQIPAIATGKNVIG